MPTVQDTVILIVDDYHDTNLMLEETLRLNGYKNIITTTDPEKAIDLARTHSPGIALLDIAMPRMNGFEVLSELRKQNPDIVVYALSGYGTDLLANEQAKNKEKFNGYLKKSVDVDQIVQLIQGTPKQP